MKFYVLQFLKISGNILENRRVSDVVRLGERHDRFLGVENFCAQILHRPLNIAVVLDQVCHHGRTLRCQAIHDFTSALPTVPTRKRCRRNPRKVCPQLSRTTFQASNAGEKCESRAWLCPWQRLARYHELQGKLRRLPPLAGVVQPRPFDRWRPCRFSRARQRRVIADNVLRVAAFR